MTPREVYFLALNNPSEFKKNKEYYESILATDSYYSYHYALYVLHGRFEKGEFVIATVIHHSYWYARDVLRGRFELGEYSIALSNKFRTDYLLFIHSNDKHHIYYKFI